MDETFSELSAPELADRIYRDMADMSDSDVAKEVRKTQPYVSKLRRIRENVSHELLKRWRKEQVPVSVMYTLSRVETHAAQLEKFEKLRASPRLRSNWARRGHTARSVAAARTTTIHLTAEDDRLLMELQKKRPSMTQTRILRRALRLLARQEGVLPAPRGRH